MGPPLRSGVGVTIGGFLELTVSHEYGGIAGSRW